jgi:SagB-type dehydrogenase family enzyme
MRHGIGHEFVEKTKHRYLGPSDQHSGAPQPPLEATFEGGGPVLPLPKPDAIASPLCTVIESRTSVRAYRSTPLTQEELSYLLWCTQGVKTVDYGHTFRTVPSAGARHALETIVLVNRVEGLGPGLYRYRALDHMLQEYVMGAAVAGALTSACLGQTFITQSAVTFIWIAVADRMTWRYGERGYRYLFLDAGHVCQNFYLAAESIGCGACAIAAYDDDRVNHLLRLDGTEKFAIYLASAGKKES